jgi:PLD-like domain
VNLRKAIIGSGSVMLRTTWLITSAFFASMLRRAQGSFRFVEHLADLGRETGEIEWLYDQLYARVESALMYDRAARRGVSVRLLADRTTPCEPNTGMELIAEAGASVWIDHGVRIAHSKTMVIDGKVTLVGSMNWSKGAALNSENLNLIVSPEVAETYAAHCRQGRMVPIAHSRRWPVSKLGCFSGT